MDARKSISKNSDLPFFDTVTLSFHSMEIDTGSFELKNVSLLLSYFDNSARYRREDNAEFFK
jgi:hypothetical protein